MSHQFTERQIAGFWSHVLDTGGCWLWTGHVSEYGYGRVRWLGTWHQAHRVSYQIHRGDIPAGIKVCHSCDVRHCVNPDHFFLGTQQENIADMDRKGRRNGGRGSSHARTHLTEDDVRCIRNRVGKGEVQRVVASEYGIDSATISHIVRRRTWRHVD